jgi:hypothetical protein
LHIGSYDYANSWAGDGGKLLLVEFDPQDAVSVPDDSSFQKLRVAKYKVVADITDTRKELEKAVYEANKPIYGSNEDEGVDLPDSWEDESEDYDADSLNVRNYVENKLADGLNPTLKQVQSRMKGSGLTCKDIAVLLSDLGYFVDENEDVPLSQSKVYE